MPPNDTASPGFRLEPNVRCAVCGSFGAFPFPDEPLCTDCYAARGSCCAETPTAPPVRENDASQTGRRCPENKNNPFENR